MKNENTILYEKIKFTKLKIVKIIEEIGKFENIINSEFNQQIKLNKRLLIENIYLRKCLIPDFGKKEKEKKKSSKKCLNLYDYTDEINVDLTPFCTQTFQDTLVFKKKRELSVNFSGITKPPLSIFNKKKKEISENKASSISFTENFSSKIANIKESTISSQTLPSKSKLSKSNINSDQILNEIEKVNKLISKYKKQNTSDRKEKSNSTTSEEKKEKSTTLSKNNSKINSTRNSSTKKIICINKEIIFDEFPQKLKKNIGPNSTKEKFPVVLSYHFKK